MRTASCPCGQLKADCLGEPVRISVCHCLNCQQRSGSSFAAQARWPADRLTMRGDWREWQRTGDSGSRATFRFCPHCGVTVAYVSDAMPDLVAVPIGTFADPGFAAPVYSVYEERKHGWVQIVGDGIEHFA